MRLEIGEAPQVDIAVTIRVERIYALERRDRRKGFRQPVGASQTAPHGCVIRQIDPAIRIEITKHLAFAEFFYGVFGPWKANRKARKSARSTSPS